MLQLLFIILFIVLTTVVVLGGGGCPGFILCMVVGLWLANKLDDATQNSER